MVPGSSIHATKTHCQNVRTVAHTCTGLCSIIWTRLTNELKWSDLFHSTLSNVHTPAPNVTLRSELLQFFCWHSLAFVFRSPALSCISLAFGCVCVDTRLFFRHFHSFFFGWQSSSVVFVRLYVYRLNSANSHSEHIFSADASLVPSSIDRVTTFPLDAHFPFCRRVRRLRQPLRRLASAATGKRAPFQLCIYRSSC